VRALNSGLLVGVVVAQSVTWGWTQPSHLLRSRIPKPDPKKYHAIRDGKDWKNPMLVIRPEGIEVIGITPVAQAIPAESVLDELEHLPDSAWPYGLIVMVSDAGIVSSANVLPRIQANRAKLLKILKAHGIAADLWPSA
jgi:hypothetical protein